MLRYCSRCLGRVWRCDDSLVALPPGVRRCEVYRNVLSLDEEEAIYAELSRIMEREGQTVLKESSTTTNKVVRHTYMEMYGLKHTFTEVKSWRKREVRRLPGMTWSPTLLRVLRTIPRHVMGMECSHYHRPPPCPSSSSLSSGVAHRSSSLAAASGGARAAICHQHEHDSAIHCDAATTTTTTRITSVNVCGDEGSNASVMHMTHSDDGGELPDMARVVEHNLPGYEMHMEHPSTGLGFLYFNLLADTVLDLDDECSQRRGQVYLPARSMMAVSQEVRWGFRFGEAPQSVHYFSAASSAATSRRVDTDLRMSVQVWKLRPHLLDARILQERMEQSVVAYLAGHGRDDSSRSARTESACDGDVCDADGSTALVHDGTHTKKQQQQQHKYNTVDEEDTAVAATGDPVVASHAVAQSLETSSTEGQGLLGGDYVRAHDGRTPATAVRGAAKVTLGDVASDYAGYKTQFKQVHGILQEMKALHDAGQPVNDVWYRRKLAETSGADWTAEREKNGFDGENLEATWDGADAKARFYKAKLRTMDYDGTAFAHSSMPDLSSEVPLDMRSTIRKVAPLVKDGDKILAGLPGGDAVCRGAR